ncbi:MAG: S41 family peptidase [Pirellulaceae bacterium]
MRQSPHRMRVWSLLLLVLGSPWATAQTSPRIQIPPSAVADLAEMGGVINQGRELEGEKRWSEALRYYRAALKSNPGQAFLRERMDAVKSHVDVARRYADKSFVASVADSSRQQSLAMLNEILGKIDRYYVNRPSWSRIVERGVRQLESSLQNTEFCRIHNLSDRGHSETSHYIAELRAEFANRIFRSRHDAYWAADHAAQLGQQRIGIRPTAIVLEFASAASYADDYSTFLTPAQLDETFSQIEGSFVGLGVELKVDQRTLLIVHVIEGGPADEVGLRDGDRIVGVGGQSTVQLGAEKAADMLRGEAGSAVRIEVQSRETRRSIQVTRRRVDVPSVERVQILDRQKGVGYFHLTNFQKTTGRDVNEALWALHRQGMRSLIIDLRGNPGGLLPASVNVADKFLASGLIVSTRGRSAGEDADFTAHSPGTWDTPLYVLIDGDSASASEILAGAIHDHRRGIVIGQRSYGKGSVQGIFRLNHDIGIRLTTAKFFSPSGQAISGVGIQPDVAVEMVARVSPDGTTLPLVEDPVIRAGLNLAQRNLAQR